MDFLPSVGPGYDDTAVRPWNRVHTKHREAGDYYEEYFQKAVSLRPKVKLKSLHASEFKVLQFLLHFDFFPVFFLLYSLRLFKNEHF